MEVIRSLDDSATAGVVLLILRLYLGCMIFVHGYRKIFRGGKLAGTARWFESIGMKPGKINAYAAAFTEVGAGIFLILGLLTAFACAALAAVMLVAVVSVHRKNGFMITNPGGGVEYCLTIAVASLTLGALGPGRYSLDFAFSIFMNWSVTGNFFVVLVLGMGGAASQLAMTYRPPRDRRE